MRRDARRAAPAYWIIDEASFPKAGKHSAGVARQYCGALGKLANCQVAVSLHRAGQRAGEGRPLSWRLYLPEGWSADPLRRAAAGIPAEVSYQSKTDLALAVLDEALGWGAKPGVVLADEAYGASFEWRTALRQRGLAYAVRVPWTTTAWSQGRKGPQTNRFARLPLWAANGWRSGPQPERVQESLLVGWPQGAPEPTRYWLARPARNYPSPSWWPRPRRAGGWNRTTVNLKRNSASTTSRVAPGRAGATTSPWSAPPSPFCARNNDAGALPAPKKKPAAAAPADPAPDSPAAPGHAHPLGRPVPLVPHPL